MCGLLGHLGNKKNPVKLDKFNILGILNEERGRHSCGVTMDGEILKGIDSLKVYRDFVAFYDLLPPKYTTGMIGHTRHATFGVHSEENAHPFGFGSLDSSSSTAPIFEFVGVHNGTLLNHTKLADTGNIKLTKSIEEVNESIIAGQKVKTTKTKSVSKIDSEVLLERIYKDKNYSVLSEYNGAAALIWQDLNKPNTMFFYHGKSAKSEFDDEIVEERPLYYWKENKNSMYVSSIIDSLYIIGGNEESIGEFTHNVVYEVKDGDIAKAKKTSINRVENWKTKGYAPINSIPGFGDKYGSKGYGNSSKFQGWKKDKTAYKIATSSPKMGTSAQLQLNLEVPIDKGLLAETFDFDPNQNNGLTMCKQLRYWRNGHLANGMYIYVNGNGFYFLGFNQKAAMERIKNLAGHYFWNGEFHSVLPTRPEFIPSCQPIDIKQGKINAMSYLHYIYDGIRMKTYTDWQAAQENSKGSRIKFDIISLSISACHPVIDLEVDVDKRTAGAYYGGTLADTTYSFLGSSKLYKFKTGQIKDIKYIPGLEPKLLSKTKPEVITLNRAATFLDKSLRVNGYTTLEEKDLLRDLVSLDKVIGVIKETGDDKVKIVSEKIEGKINDILFLHFSNASTDYVATLDKLEQYKSGSTKAALACDILTNLINLNGE
jgi:predicted glutamine amidotransferase